MQASSKYPSDVEHQSVPKNGNPRLVIDSDEIDSSLEDHSAYEVFWSKDDPENPKNWSALHKCVTIFAMGYSATVVSLFSTSYTVGIIGLQEEFHISKLLGFLGVTTYLFGMAVGSIVLAPLSEMYGRRPIYIVSVGLFTIFVLPSALAKNIETILITRFFTAFFGSAMMANSAGTVTDIISERHRALAFGFWSLGPTNGPVIGPIIGGFIFESLGWRWLNWFIMILGGVAFLLVSVIEETYAPVILRKRMIRKRKETGNVKWWSRYDSQVEFTSHFWTNITRPLTMMVMEPICVFWNFYTALVYGVLYLCFVAYPLAYQKYRGWSPGIGGLAYLGIGFGSIITIALEPILRKIISSHKKDDTGNVPPEAMVSVICLSAVLLAVGQIWFAWTSTPNVHWIVPILAGVPFGAGNAGVFIYMSSYIVHSYNNYAASALAGNVVLRSIFGAILPLAGPSMYASLGLNWAGFLLGMFEVVCIAIPVVFYLYGHHIRERSIMIRRMQIEKSI
ncbi:2da8f1e7-d2ce-4e5d-acb0-3d818a9ca3bf [Sclerotinia trifoliorum]|uniref:2da8f1e7-d2ce-4e5d-acb0-3d818a9ca3bf n=1 Tax=Sclerotinia trifoliorum TaxID=28548 RepID=A0A8H2ZPX8_9HELO|nr:2da8f1e7-d2ce-4e5d-acb0-3d818a9ca3bf [Sclerotinia trifoliorum]